MFKFLLSALLLSGLASSVVAAPDPPTYGQQCATIAGAVKCAPGLTCCYLHPDDGKCYRVCPKTV
ncbi:hypothetical protein PQX77_000938 [Marasmius sp. AFHP31]|nr:hypothetical protein PQX77_000938 [Marasmius sp. AFHP31]